MTPIKLKNQRPEDKVREKVITKLRYHEWYVKITHGNRFQSGIPDLLCCHSCYGIRFVEIKLPNMQGSKFTPAQMVDFPKFIAHGCGIWILTGDSDEEYQKLFKKSNFWQYLDVFKNTGGL